MIKNKKNLLFGIFFYGVSLDASYLSNDAYYVSPLTTYAPKNFIASLGYDAALSFGSIDAGQINDTMFGVQAQSIINTVFQSMDAYVLGVYDDPNIRKQSIKNQILRSDIGKSHVHMIVQAMNYNFDTLRNTIGASTSDMKPIKDAFSQAITFFGTKSPQNIQSWLPKIVDAAKIIVTAPVKLAVQIGATGTGALVGAAIGAQVGIKQALQVPLSELSNQIHYLAPRASYSIGESLLTVSLLIPTTIAVSVRGVIEAPFIAAYHTTIGAYTGARVGHDAVKRSVTGPYVLRKAQELKQEIHIDENDPDFIEITFSPQDEVRKVSQKASISVKAAKDQDVPDSVSQSSLLVKNPRMIRSQSLTDEASLENQFESSSFGDDDWVVQSRPTTPVQDRLASSIVASKQTVNRANSSTNAHKSAKMLTSVVPSIMSKK